MIPDSTAREWCERAAKGDVAAASELLTEFHKPIYAYFRRLSGKDSDAADLTQSTFIKVWQSLPRFRGDASVSSWIHRIAYCTYVDWLRRSRPATEQTESWWLSIPGESPIPFDEAADRESSRQVYAAVEQLDEEDRQVIHLHYYQGLSLADTADVLELSASTVKYRLRGALEILRRSLQKLDSKSLHLGKS